jgi:hypothetical protein
VRKTEAEYVGMVKVDGIAIYDAPLEYRTLEVCLAAVEQSGMALVYVPEALQAEVERRLAEEA